MAKTRRRGMGKGMGSGYHNIIPKDPGVHSDSARGRKQPQGVVALTYIRNTKGFIAEHYNGRNLDIIVNHLKKRGVALSTIKGAVEQLHKEGGLNKVPQTLINKTLKGLDAFEKQQYQQMLKTRKDPVKVLDTMVNSVSASELSKSLADYAKQRALFDTDKDGVPDMLDCDPKDPKKQDIKADEVIETLTEEEKKNFEELISDGMDKESALEKTIIFSQPSYTEDGLTKPMSENLRTFAYEKGLGKIVEDIDHPKKVSLFEKGKAKLQEFQAKRKAEAQQKRKLELRQIDHPLLLKEDKQQKRVNEISVQIDKSRAKLDDEETSGKVYERLQSKIEELEEELDREQEQLREVQEKVTEINVEDLSDSELKTLAVRHKDDSLFGSSNEYKDELLRRIRSKAEIDRDTARIENEERIERERLNKELAEERRRAKGDSGWF